MSAVKVADACLVVVDAAARLTDERRDLLGSLIDTVAANGAEPWLVLNKMDLVHKRWRRAKRKEYEEAARSAYAGLEHVHPISAQHMVGVDALRDALFDAAKPGDWCVHLHANVTAAWGLPHVPTDAGDPRWTLYLPTGSTRAT